MGLTQLTVWVLGDAAGHGRGAVVIDGNGDGIWWQVLAVAFRRHWAVGGQVLAVDGLQLGVGDLF